MSEEEKQEKIAELLRLSKSEKTVKQKNRYDVVLLNLELYTANIYLGES